jgi:hypothetical protein
MSRLGRIPKDNRSSPHDHDPFPFDGIGKISKGVRGQLDIGVKTEDIMSLYRQKRLNQIVGEITAVVFFVLDEP